MEPIYLGIVLILMLLAASDLMVGVANDAVNFLNSAVGSKAAPRYVILTVATIGIFVGVFTSGGMMEVARSGVFHPSMFTFSDIMMLFLAVMLTDVILLDVFNTLGLPTSTTVSLVFELLGAAVCVALFTISRSDTATLADISQYINSTKALAIISGILVSVVIAFVCGTIIMYLTRLIFSFNFQSKIRTIGTLWCGIALTAITYFAVFKGFQNTSIFPDQIMDFMNTNLWTSLLIVFIGWSVLMFLLTLIKVNILKLTVLAGTFSLALAFAGNDLVNFIGVFMAGYDSFEMASITGDTGMMMGGLMEPVHANVWILMASGVIMVLTLWFSRKARHVTDTEVNLGRQDSGVEQFGSTPISRALVRTSINLNKSVVRLLPIPLKRMIDSRFRPSTIAMQGDDAPSFDLIRATVNLTVAALLISMATSLKLPLSTTYVTFMVAMGSSLADRAWGRESAVYRITGVMAVISGWFLTALVAFVVAFVVASILMWGGVYAIVILTVACFYMLIHSNLLKKKSKKEKVDLLMEDDTEGAYSLVSACSKRISESLTEVTTIYNSVLTGVFTEDRKLLKQVLAQSKELHNSASQQKHDVIATLNLLNEESIETGHYYVQVVDYLDEVTKSLLQISKSTYDHIDNNHEGFSTDQVEDLKKISAKMNLIFQKVNIMLTLNNFVDIDLLMELRDSLFDDLAEGIKRQIRRNKENLNTTRCSVLYLNILAETKTMTLQLRNLLKSQKYFVEKR